MNGSLLSRRLELLAGFAAVAFATAPLQAQATTPGKRVDYLRDVKPIFKERCFACHGALKQEGNLRLDTAAMMRQGGDGGAAIVAGRPDESPLIERITAPDAETRMPPEGAPLSPEEAERIRRWIEQGAQAAPDEAPESDPREHWAFKPPVRPPLPRQADGSSPAHPVDAFVAARLDAAGLAPRPTADKATLLRRVYLDLIGLPPTRTELHAFLADNAPDAYESVVDRLLADPRYGERWGRHWMDVWRYSDWYGRRHVPDVWNSAPQIWRWRDWIVRSLNEDRGYDQMVREMLAADEAAPDDPAAAVATGYLIRNWYALNPNDWMRANVEHASKAFLGLTFHCAHCHDHKYDPITQDDYFRLRAFFEPINIRQDRVAGQADPGPFQQYESGVLRKIQRLGAVQVYDKNPEAPTWFYTGGDERNRATDRGTMAPALPAFLGGDSVKIEPVSLPWRAYYPGLRPEILDAYLSDQRAAIAAAEKQLATTRGKVEQALPPLREQLTAAEKAFAQTTRDERASGSSAAIEGKQSLLLNATTGRRAVQNPLAMLKSLGSGATLSFQLRILKDAHVNFQLAQDLVQGLTAAVVAFDQGRILAYRPGGHTEFQAGAYDFAGGQALFEATLTLEAEADRCLLTVRSLSDNKLLVDKSPVALNGWNPVGDAKKGISFDARTGVVAAIDAVKIVGPGGEEPQAACLAQFTFEPPTYAEQQDLAGIEGWEISPFSQAGATSVVAATLDDDALAAASEKRRLARRAVAAQELRLAAAEAKVAATAAAMASIEARAAADRAKWGAAPNADSDALARIASQRHREAAVKRAEADVLTHDQALAAAETKPASDANRAKEMAAAGKQLATARVALKKVQAALADPALATTYPSIGPTYPKTSTGRRRALAQWITSRENPLAARVAVNHIWLRHFHSPLVSSVFDFGRNGARPTHPALLDWLAVEFMESGWSMKHIHRLLTTSQAYRRVSSIGDAACYASDPENKLWWRMNAGRMEAEAVRDSVIYVAGRLDFAMGGQELENSEALTTFRRTLYYSCQPEIDGKNPLGALFDAPEPADCYRRTRSVVPQQALALANSELVHEMSGQLAQALLRELPAERQTQPRHFITAAFEQILTRAPSAEELEACAAYLEAPTNDSSAPDAAGRREGLVRALLNHNDFVSIR